MGNPAENRNVRGNLIRPHSVEPEEPIESEYVEGGSADQNLNTEYIDVEDDRETGTSYQNTTGGPIRVYYRGTTDGTGGDELRVDIRVDSSSALGSTSIKNGGRIPDPGQNSEQAASAVVPDGMYYRIGEHDETTTRSWHELEVEIV